MFNLTRQEFEAYVTVPQAFSPHEIDIIRALIENQEKGPGIVGNGETDKSIRDSRIKWLFWNDAAAQWIFERVAAIVSETNTKYFGMDLRATEGIQLTEYDSEYKGFYGAHTDSSYDIAAASRNRKLSITMQLSDPSEYDGGELALYWQNIKGPAIGSKKKGDMTIFRSHIIHEVLPVTRGRRYSFVTWVHGPLFK